MEKCTSMYVKIKPATEAWLLIPAPPVLTPDQRSAVIGSHAPGNMVQTSAFVNLVDNKNIWGLPLW